MEDVCRQQFTFDLLENARDPYSVSEKTTDM